MVDTSKFITHIFVDIFDKNICSENTNLILGGTKNTLKQCIKRNKGIGPKVVTMITNLISREIDINKKNKGIQYIKGFLNESELLYMKNNPEDIKSLVSFVTEKFPIKNKKTNSENFKIVDIDILLNEGWTIQNIIDALINIDYQEIDGITQEHEGEPSQWYEVLRDNSETYRYLMNGSEMIGYWHFTPLFDKWYEKAKNGQLLDSEITTDTIPYLLPGTYNIYFIAICLKQDFRRKNSTFGKLLFSIVDVIEDFAEKHIFFDEICALAYSKSGDILCQTLGLKYLRNHIEHGKIYVGKINDLLDRQFCNYYIELKNKYKHLS